MTTLAWHNNPNLKQEVMTRLRAHRAEDSIIKGLYQQLAPELASGYRGCAIGCTLPPQNRIWSDRGVVRHTKPGSKQRAAVDAVIALYRRRVDGEEIAEKEWRAAADAADVAAAYAAAAAYADDDDDAYAARRGLRTWQAERLIHHLTTAPIGAAA